MENLEVLAQQYRSILGTEKTSNWDRGEIALEVLALHNESKDAGILEAFLKTTGESKTLLYQCSWVVKSFRDCKSVLNLPGLSWSHYRTAAGAPDPEHWISKAFEGEWTVKRLKDEMDAAKVEKKIQEGAACVRCQCKIQESAVRVLIDRKGKLFCSPRCAGEYLLELADQSSPAEQ